MRILPIPMVSGVSTPIRVSLKARGKENAGSSIGQPYLSEFCRTSPEVELHGETSMRDVDVPE